MERNVLYPVSSFSYCNIRPVVNVGEEDTVRTQWIRHRYILCWLQRTEEYSTISQLAMHFWGTSNIFFFIKVFCSFFKDYKSFSYRTHTCGDLRLKDVGQQVTLCGWIQHKRMGLFVTIRDSQGVTQLVSPEEKVQILLNCLKVWIMGLLDLLFLNFQNIQLPLGLYI